MDDQAYLNQLHAVDPACISTTGEWAWLKDRLQQLAWRNDGDRAQRSFDVVWSLFIRLKQLSHDDLTAIHYIQAAIDLGLLRTESASHQIAQAFAQGKLTADEFRACRES